MGIDNNVHHKHIINSLYFVLGHNRLKDEEDYICGTLHL